jgi:hypothetical protein
VDENTRQLSELLHQAAETHHQVFAMTDGEDPDWATWYSDWLVNLSKMPELVGTKPVRSEVTYLLVGLDKEYAQAAPSVRWEDFYADRLMLYLSARG